jgi:hypothetical protein
MRRTRLFAVVAPLATAAAVVSFVVGGLLVTSPTTASGPTSKEVPTVVADGPRACLKVVDEVVMDCDQPTASVPVIHEDLFPGCEEDEPCWDCETMGNSVCGPVKVPSLPETR